MTVLLAWALAATIGAGLYLAIRRWGIPGRKPCGCKKEIGGTPWKKRLNSDLKSGKYVNYRVDYVETARECEKCGEMNVVREAWSAVEGTKSPHPVWHQYKKDKSVRSDYTDEYKEAHTWTKPENVDRICRWDYSGNPHYVEYESWDGR